MTQTEWIIIAVTVLLVLAAILLLRRRGPAGDTIQPMPTPDEVAHAPHFVDPIVPPVLATPIVPPVPVEVEAQAVPSPPPPAAEPTDAPADDLSRMKGVGPKILAILHAEGITRYAQIAAWTDADISAFDARLGSFKGRPVRDNWVDQARLLAAGDHDGYQAKYGRL